MVNAADLPIGAFEFATAGRIVFGAGKVQELGAIARTFGTSALLVCGRTAERAAPLREQLERSGVEVTLFGTAGEPDIATVTEGADLARKTKCRVVIGAGGGSAIDAAKAIAALATNQHDVMEYLEVIGRARPFEITPLPVIAVPTTAGTGAEVTRNAVLCSPEHRVKASLRHAGMLPRVAIVDPELTLNLPRRVTLSTGLDAITQLIEAFVCRRANAMTDALCREALPDVVDALLRAADERPDLVARSRMSLAALCSGIALANAGLGAVHGFAAVIGGSYAAAHGDVCASLLPAVMQMNVTVARATGVLATVERYDHVARLLSGRTSARADDAVNQVAQLHQEQQLPRLRDFGIKNEDFATIAGKAAVASSMKGNPVALSAAQLNEILAQAW